MNELLVSCITYAYCGNFDVLGLNNDLLPVISTSFLGLSIGETFIIYAEVITPKLFWYKLIT